MDGETHRLFFALRPTLSIVPALSRAVAMAQSRNLFRGNGTAASKFHLTLHFLGNHPMLPVDMLENALAAAAGVRFAPFQFVLDSVNSFRDKRPSPCVLRCPPDSDAALQSFWRKLRDVLIARGLDEHAERPFTPHVTLGYGDKPLFEPIPIEPIVWTADEFVLIDSLVGKSTHNELGRWALDAD